MIRTYLIEVKSYVSSERVPERIAGSRSDDGLVLDQHRQARGLSGALGGRWSVCQDARGSSNLEKVGVEVGDKLTHEKPQPN